MKQNRHQKIAELVSRYEIETQEELAEKLRSRIYGDAGDNFPRYPSDEPFQASDRKWAAEICDSEKRK